MCPYDVQVRHTDCRMATSTGQALFSWTKDAEIMML